MFTLTQFLSSELERRKISKSDISRNTSLSYSTVHRSFNGEREFTELEMVEVLLHVYSNSEEARNIVSTKFPQNKIITNLLSRDTGSLQFNSKQQEYFSNYDSFALSNLVHVGYLHSIQQVQEIYGISGVGLIQKMQRDSLLTIDSHGNIKTSHDTHNSTLTGIKDQIANATKFHKQSNCGQMKNYAYFGTRLLSKERRNLVHRLSQLFVEMMKLLITSNEIPEKNLKRLSDIIIDSKKLQEGQKTEPCFIGLIYDDFLSPSKLKETYQ